jgi:hypothetical protein
LCIEKFNSWVIIITTTTRVMMKPWQQSSNETEHPEQKGERKYKEIRDPNRRPRKAKPKVGHKGFQRNKIMYF